MRNKHHQEQSDIKIRNNSRDVEKESENIFEEIQENDKGIAFQLKRIILKPNTYPKAWRLSSKDHLKRLSTRIEGRIDSA